MASSKQNGAINADLEVNPTIAPKVGLDALTRWFSHDGDMDKSKNTFTDKSKNTDKSKTTFTDDSKTTSKNTFTDKSKTIFTDKSKNLGDFFSGNNLTKVGPLLQLGGTNTYIVGEQPNQAEQMCSLPATNTNMNYMNPYMQQGYGVMPMCQPMMMQPSMMMPPFDMSSYYMWMQQQMQPQGPQINGFEDAKYAAYEAGFNVDYTEKRTAGRFADIKNMTSEERINRAKELLTGVDLTTDQKADVLSSMSPEADDFEM